MLKASSFFVMIGIPVYVMSVFVAQVFAPGDEKGVKSGDTIILSFVGDMMFDRYVRERAETSGYGAIFKNVENVFSESDILIGNLEGPITTFRPVSNWRVVNANHYKFTFATTVAEVLHKEKFTVVNLANNHIFNFGKDGLKQTKEWLLKSGVDYIGSPDELYKPWRYSNDAHEIAVYSFDNWYARDVDEMSARISSEGDNVFVIVFAHWGDEYEDRPNKGQIEAVHKFIDAGADFVVGSHPHVVQSKEKYKDKWIYYSLGNFVFDQYFSDEVKCGLVLNLSLYPDTTYKVNEKFAELVRDGTTKESSCMNFVPEISLN